MAKVNPLDLLDSMAVDKPTAAKKNEIPVLSVPKQIEAKVKEIKTLSDEIESKQAKMKLLSQEVIDYVEPERVGMCEHGNFTTSVKVPDGDNGTCLVSWVAKYSKIELAQVDTIEKALGDKMNQYIAIETEISFVNPTDTELLTKLIKALGVDEFKKSFKVVKQVKVKDAYTKEFFQLPKDKRSTLAQVIVQQRPSVKTK